MRRIRVLLAMVSVGGIGESGTATEVDERIVLASTDIPRWSCMVRISVPAVRRPSFFSNEGNLLCRIRYRKGQERRHRKKLLDAQKGVPFANIYGKPVHHFSEQAYLRALKGRK